MLDGMKIRILVSCLSLAIFTANVRGQTPIVSFGPASAQPTDVESLKIYPLYPDTLEGEGLRSFEFDLNEDGKKEFIRVFGPSLCGTGGCPYEIFDGLSKKRVGELFGNPVWIFKEKINGWPVLSVYSHGSAASGSYGTFVYDGKKYIGVSSVYLYQKSVEELFEKYKAVPKVEQK